MNGTSYFYAHTDQWRYETLKISEILSPLAPEGDWSGSMIDFNARAERMGWLPSAPQFEINPLELCRHIHETGAEPATVVAYGARSGSFKPASLGPDIPANWPPHMFFWRSYVLGALGTVTDYFL